MGMKRNNSEASELVVGHLLSHAGMGGAETYVSLIANTHAQVGRGSNVIVLSEPGPVSERLAAGVGVTYLHYRRESIRNPLRFLVSVVRGYRAIARAVRDAGIQVLQTHLPDTNLWGLALTLTGRCRVVITIHNNKFLRGTDGRSFANFVKLAAYRQMFSKCGAVVAVSHEVKNSMIAQLNLSGAVAETIVVVENGVPVPEDLDSGAKVALRRQYGIGADEFWIVAAGRLTEAKNFRMLVEAASLLGEQVPPFRIVIGGEGKLRSDLEAQIVELGLQNIIAMPGNLQNLGDVMRAADLLVMPSKWEGLPMVLLEGMARRLPVVGTRISGLADIIEEGRHGYLVEVDDSVTLAAGIEKMIQDPDRRVAMGQACREWVQQKYDFSRVYSDLCKVYEKAMSR